MKYRTMTPMTTTVSSSPTGRLYWFFTKLLCDLQKARVGLHRVPNVEGYVVRGGERECTPKLFQTCYT